MKTLGYIMTRILLASVLGITMGLFIRLPISQQENRTLAESISGLIENLKGKSDGKH